MQKKETNVWMLRLSPGRLGADLSQRFSLVVETSAVEVTAAAVEQPSLVFVRRWLGIVFTEEDL